MGKQLIMEGSEEEGGGGDPVEGGWQICDQGHIISRGGGNRGGG